MTSTILQDAQSLTIKRARASNVECAECGEVYWKYLEEGTTSKSVQAGTRDVSRPDRRQLTRVYIVQLSQL
jgi:hypothetical protein